MISNFVTTVAKYRSNLWPLKRWFFNLVPFTKPTWRTPIYSQWSESKWHSFLLLQLLSLLPLLFPSDPDDLKHPGKWGRERGESRIARLHGLSRRHLWNKVTLIATCLLRRLVNPWWLRIAYTSFCKKIVE